MIHNFRDLKKLENIHIPLWLIKDTCWMMEWKELGISMIFPTVTIAFLIAWKTRKEPELWINLAICCWIMANSYWMLCEFVGHPEKKTGAAWPFCIGLLFTLYFYGRQWWANRIRISK